MSQPEKDVIKDANDMVNYVVNRRYFLMTMAQYVITENLSKIFTRKGIRSEIFAAVVCSFINMLSIPNISKPVPKDNG